MLKVKLPHQLHCWIIIIVDWTMHHSCMSAVLSDKKFSTVCDLWMLISTDSRGTERSIRRRRRIVTSSSMDTWPRYTIRHIYLKRNCFGLRLILTDFCIVAVRLYVSRSRLRTWGRFVAVATSTACDAVGLSFALSARIRPYLEILHSWVENLKWSFWRFSRRILDLIR